MVETTGNGEAQVPPSDWVKRAKQADETAIAALLNLALQPDAITTKTRLVETCLKILLESAQSVDSSPAIALIQAEMQHLQPTQIQTVQIYWRSANATKLVQLKSFTLEPAVESASAAMEVRSQRSTVAPSPTRSHQAQASHQTQTKPLILKPQRINAAGLGALGTGLILAIAVFTISLLNLLFSGFLVMVHEVGHAVTHWSFGRPAIPTVNILFGGGITLAMEQVPLLVLAIYLGFAGLLYRVRYYPRLQGVLVVMIGLYTYCLLTPTNRMLSTLMGHGMEWVAIAACLYLATSGYFCRIKGDRTIYAMLGFFTLFRDIQFSWQLIYDADYRAWYEGGIGGMLDNDFVILATTYFRVDLATIAGYFLIACGLAPAIAFLLFRYEAWWRLGGKKLLEQP